MSYILDALRKSEKKRQEAEAENVTERILVSPPAEKPSSSKWITILVLANLIFIGYLAWYFGHKNGDSDKQPPRNQARQELPVAPAVPAKPSVPTVPPAANNVPQAPKQLPAMPPPITALQTNPQTASISEMMAAKQKAEALRNAKPTEMETKQPAAPPKTTTVKSAQNPKNAFLRHSHASLSPPMPEPVAKSAPLAPSKPPAEPAARDVKDLPYETRNNLPDLTINVFSYAREPADRFVIINMVKYHAGQLINGQVKIKDIRSDGLILQRGNDTFKVERP